MGDHPKLAGLGATVAVVLLLVFVAAVGATIWTVGDPPLLADVAPTAPPTPLASTAPAELSPQLRGAYDPNARLLALLAIVSPLVTTIVGFFFGQRAGEARAAAAETEKKAAVGIAADEVARASGGNREDLLDRLRRDGLI